MKLSYLSAKTEVRQSKIHGKGLFAREPIARTELVAIKGGYIVTAQQIESLDPQLMDSEIQIDDNLFIMPVNLAEREDSMLYINHSCEPNAAIMGQITFIAMRDIERDEEITADWATTDDLDYRINCHCGRKSCRGIITGKDWMQSELQRKYKGWFCWFLQRKIDALNRE